MLKQMMKYKLFLLQYYFMSRPIYRFQFDMWDSYLKLDRICIGNDDILISLKEERKEGRKEDKDKDKDKDKEYLRILLLFGNIDFVDEAVVCHEGRSWGIKIQHDVYKYQRPQYHG